MGCVFWQVEKGGFLDAVTARKRGVLGADQTRKKGGLRCGSGQKRGVFPRHIPILNIYVSTPPPPPGSGLTMHPSKHDDRPSTAYITGPITFCTSFLFLHYQAKNEVVRQTMLKRGVFCRTMGVEKGGSFPRSLFICLDILSTPPPPRAWKRF